MKSELIEKLRKVKTITGLLGFLEREMGWPIDRVDLDELTFSYTPEELGLKREHAAGIKFVKRLRPLMDQQPWGIFFVEFEKKQLPIESLRIILSHVAQTKRKQAKKSDHISWSADDILFISNYGSDDRRKIALANFRSNAENGLATLKVIGWDESDAPLHLDSVATSLTECLAWPDDEHDFDSWRDRWRSAFVLTNKELITTSKGLSSRLAELARAIRNRVEKVLEIEDENGPLSKILAAFRASLMHDMSKQEFADMYAQTISYGLLSARITDPQSKTLDDLSTHMQTTPFLRDLMELFIYAGSRSSESDGSSIDFDLLGVSEVVQLLDNANLEAVIRNFGDLNPLEDPVIHFYEMFLFDYDKKQKVNRGVYYTPRPVVMKIVNLVHEELRSKFGLEDGLADTSTWAQVVNQNTGLELPLGVNPDSDFVQILDPATGTGTFLVEAIDLIFSTMRNKWQAAGHDQSKIRQLWNDYVPKHLLTRLYAYELLMAPFAICHLKIGLKLYETGYEFKDIQRAGVFLTNALEPKLDFSNVFDFAADILSRELNEVNQIKESHRFTVVIGNPPYSNFGQLNRSPHILDLLKDYKKDLTERKINLDDDFIKFLRFAQSVIETTGSGVVGMITNNVFLDGITHRSMRKNLLENFSEIKIIDLHGNVSAQEVASDGSSDENVFDITQGVCISILCRRLIPGEGHSVSFSSLKGSRNFKYEKLLVSEDDFKPLNPKDSYYFFTPKDFALEPEYMTFVPLPEVFKSNSYGIQTKRDSLTIAFQADQVLDRANFLLENSDDVVRDSFSLPADGRDWKISLARDDLEMRQNLSDHLEQVLYRPFDLRWTLYTGKTKGFLGYPRWASMKCMLDDNLGLIAMRQVFQDVDVYSHFGVSNSLIDERTFYSNRGGTYLFPLYLSSDEQPTLLSDVLETRESNFSSEYLMRLSMSLGVRYESPVEPSTIFHYIYACVSSVEYRRRYKEFLKVDFPRVPLVSSPSFFNELAALGEEIIKVQVNPQYRSPDSQTAFVGQSGSVIGKCRWTSDSLFLGEDQSIRFVGLSKDIWEFHYGGYQVLNKWLKDRRGEVLTEEMVQTILSICDRLGQSITLMSRIDVCIDAHGGWPGAFS
jgi:hypothetical protein